MSTPLKELLKGNDEYFLQLFPNCLGSPVSTSDIGHEVMPSRLASVTRVATGSAGHLLFVLKS